MSPASTPSAAVSSTLSIPMRDYEPGVKTGQAHTLKVIHPHEGL